MGADWMKDTMRGKNIRSEMTSPKVGMTEGAKGTCHHPIGQRSPADEPYSLNIALIQFGPNM